jgi:iron complex transport system substrate-binding protein
VMNLRSLLLFALVAISFGCTRPVDVAQVEIPTRELRDDLGRTVRVPEKIDRAISLAPSLTEMIYAIGAGDRLLGVTTYCNYPTETAKVEKVGDTQTPNIERIIALKPQVIFISTASQLEAFSRTLDEQDIAVYVIDAKSLEGVFKNLKTLGELFGRSDDAEKLVDGLAVRAKLVRDQASAQEERPRVFIQISNEPLFTIGNDSFLTELIDQAGGVSATRDVPSAYPKLSKETAAALDPEVIILSDSEDNLEPNAALKNSTAVREGRVYRINADIISRPGPRLVDALEQIADRLREKK